ncbi:MAG: hypothetical protein LBV55_01720 [Acholeplasmatales bacterium]|jgi:hypothetical protein|nr:hypothetical protein [Acholeplasmatales bacterium]
MANKEQKSNRETKKKKKPAKKDSKDSAKDAVSTTAKVPVFKDPTKTLWGKIIVWILIFGMGALIIVALVISIVNNAGGI